MEIAQLQAENDKLRDELERCAKAIEMLREALEETNHLHGLRLCEACDFNRSGIDCTCRTPAVIALEATEREWSKP